MNTNVNNVNEVISDFCAKKNVKMSSIGKYARFITSVRDLCRYHGHPVCTDVYLNEATNEFLIIKECPIDDQVFDAKVMKYSDLLNMSNSHKVTYSFENIYNSSKIGVQISDILVRRVNNVLTGYSNRNRYDGVRY